MKTSTIMWVIVVLVVVLGGWYWYSMQPAATSVNGVADQANTDGLASADGTPDQGTEGDGTSVSQNLALGTDSSAELGTYLIAYNGMTVYLYTKDTKGVSNCSGQCAINWPPYTVPAGSTLNTQAGVTGAIGTIERADGSLQVTYNGIPLYFWKDDKKSGDTTGQNVGGVWFVVKP